MTNNNYRVLKLRSGETLIASLVEDTKNHIKVDNPYEIKRMHYVDGFGQKHETVVLSDWLKSTTQRDFRVGKDFILGIFQPSPDTLSQYLKEFEPKPTKNPLGSLGFFATTSNMKDLEKLFGSLEQVNDEQMEEDIDSEDFIGRLIQGKIQQEEEKVIRDEDDPNYGSNYCDWSPDLNDYI